MLNLGPTVLKTFQSILLISSNIQTQTRDTSGMENLIYLQNTVNPAAGTGSPKQPSRLFPACRKSSHTFASRRLGSAVLRKCVPDGAAHFFFTERARAHLMFQSEDCSKCTDGRLCHRFSAGVSALAQVLGGFQKKSFQLFIRRFHKGPPPPCCGASGFECARARLCVGMCKKRGTFYLQVQTKDHRRAAKE